MSSAAAETRRRRADLLRDVGLLLLAKLALGALVYAGGFRAVFRQHVENRRHHALADRAVGAELETAEIDLRRLERVLERLERAHGRPHSTPWVTGVARRVTDPSDGRGIRRPRRGRA